MQTRLRGPVLAAVAWLLLGVPAVAGDWPMWRYDACRSAASPTPLPADLELQWTRHFSPRTQVWPEPLNRDLMSFDRVFEPVVLGQRMFIGFNDSDKVGRIYFGGVCVCPVALGASSWSASGAWAM